MNERLAKLSFEQLQRLTEITRQILQDSYTCRGIAIPAWMVQPLVNE